MQTIINNPYRIIGILSNTTEKDLLKQKTKIKRYSEVGKDITSELDFPFLSPIQRNSVVLDKAFSDIEQNQDRVTHSLFWFINLNPIDNTAIQYLISGNKEKAFEIWEKLTEEKEINSKNYSAFNNIGTLYLLEESETKQKLGIISKIKLLESEYLADFIRAVADDTYVVDPKKQIEIFTDELVEHLKKKYSIPKIITLFRNNTNIQKYLSQKFTSEPSLKIETQIELTKDKRISNGEYAYGFGMDLYKNTQNDLNLLKSILGITDLQYKMLADNVAKEILQCSIDYFNESQKNKIQKDYLSESMKLAKLAKAIAVNKITIDRINDNINTLEEMKDGELLVAIEFLNSVKSAYGDNKNKITQEVRKQELTLSFGQSINWTKVNQMIEDSIDWKKVIELVKEIIPLENVKRIEESDKQSKVSEYKSLVEFLLSKLNYSQKNQVKYLCYWKTVVTNPSVVSTTRNTSQTTSTRSSNNTTTNTYRSPSANSKSTSWVEENPGCLIAIIIGIIILLINLFN